MNGYLIYTLAVMLVCVIGNGDVTIAASIIQHYTFLSFFPYVKPTPVALYLNKLSDPSM